MSMTATQASPIACSLAAGDLKDRLAGISALNWDALRSHERRDLMLELRYGPEARDRVREMVRGERACCLFLSFDLREAPEEICLTITAPEAARDAADMLFQQFVAAAPAPSRPICSGSSDRGAPGSALALAPWQRQPAPWPVARVACFRSRCQPRCLRARAARSRGSLICVYGPPAWRSSPLSRPGLGSRGRRTRRAAGRPRQPSV
jgi:hypothetical protein